MSDDRPGLPKKKRDPVGQGEGHKEIKEPRDPG